MTYRIFRWNASETECRFLGVVEAESEKQAIEIAKQRFGEGGRRRMQAVDDSICKVMP